MTPKMTIRELMAEWRELARDGIVEMNDEQNSHYAQVMNEAIVRGGKRMEQEGFTDDDQKLIAAMMGFAFQCCGDQSMALIAASKPVAAGSIAYTIMSIAAGILTPEETGPEASAS